MASIHPQRNTRGTSWRAMWRTEDGTQRSRTLPTRPEARRFKTTVEGLEQACRAPDPTRGEITLEAWAGLVLAGLHHKPKAAETYASLLRSRILPTFGHHLRHASASLLLQQGAGMKVAQEWLGHRAERITMNTYAHLYWHELQRAAGLLDGAMSRKGRLNAA